MQKNDSYFKGIKKLKTTIICAIEDKKEEIEENKQEVKDDN